MTTKNRRVDYAGEISAAGALYAVIHLFVGLYSSFISIDYYGISTERVFSLNVFLSIVLTIIFNCALIYSLFCIASAIQLKKAD